MKQSTSRSARAIVLISLGLGLGGCDMEDLLAWKMQPGEGFSELEAPPAPDYAQAASWAARPEAPNNAALTPEGAEAPPANPGVDVFYVHPTTYYGADHWNAPIDEAASKEWVDELVVPGQATVFNGVGRIFAPRYRQAALGSYLGDMDDHIGAFDVAFGDLSRAFEVFLKETGDRPFIVAGHSQGSLHAMGLLETLDASPERERLVAAYVVGHRLPVARFGSNYQNLTPCAGALDTGCVVAWDTYGEGAEVEKDGRYPAISQGKATMTAGGMTLCVNPISWRMDTEVAEASGHLGEVRGVYSVPPIRGLKALSGEVSGMKIESLSAPKAGFLSARCDEDGILRIPELEGEEYEGLDLSPGNYHVLDYRLFFMDIRANAIARSQAYVEAHRGPEAAPLQSAKPPQSPEDAPSQSAAPVNQ